MATIRPDRIPWYLPAMAGWIGVLLLAWALAYGGGSAPSPFPASMPAVVGALLLIALAFHEDKWSPSRALSTPLLVFIGRISYSLYIWHWPVFVIFRWTVGIDRPEQMLSAIALTFVSATLSYYLVERPIRFGMPSFPHLGVISVGALAIFVGGRSMMYINSNRPRVSLSTVTRHAADWYPTGPSTSPEYPSCVVVLREIRIGSARSIIYSRAGCDEPVGNDPKLFVIGDSHAGHYDPIYREYVLGDGEACGVLRNRMQLPQPILEGRTAALRYSARGGTTGHDPQLDGDSLVFLSSLRMTKLVDQYAPGSVEKAPSDLFSDTARKGRQAAESEAETVIGELLATGARVMLPKPTPVFRAPPFRCVEAYQKTNTICAPGLSVSMDLLRELENQWSPP